MKKIIILFVLLTGCSVIAPSTQVKPPSIESHISVNSFEFVFISNGDKISSAVVSARSGYTREVAPDNLISGVLLKKGISRIYELSDALKEKTLIVSWGISGKRNVGFLGAYAQEITILMRKANNMNVVYSCSAEGLGETEADDIRDAILSCLSEI